MMRAITLAALLILAACDERASVEQQLDECRNRGGTPVYYDTLRAHVCKMPEKEASQ